LLIIKIDCYLCDATCIASSYYPVGSTSALNIRAAKA